MSRLQQIFGAILQTEENLLPIFVHNPVSQTIAAVIVTTEAEIFSIFSTPAPTTVTVTSAAPTAAPTQTATGA